MYIGTCSTRGNNYYYYYRFTLTEVTTPRGSRRRRRRRRRQCIRRSDERVYNIILYIPHTVHDKRQVSLTLSLSDRSLRSTRRIATLSAAADSEPFGSRRTMENL